MENFENVKENLKGTMYENMIQSFINPEDEIQFQCQRCGKCCQHRDINENQIMVSPLDIYNGAKALGIKPGEFMEEYTEVYIGHSSGAVCATLATNKKGDCKLLSFDENGLAKCKIHNAKPVICALHPLGIMRSVPKDSNTDVTEKQYILAERCETSKCGKPIKAKEIIGTVPGTDEETEMATKLRALWHPKKGLKFTMASLSLAAMNAIHDLGMENAEKYGFDEKVYMISTIMTGMFKEKVGNYNVLNDIEKELLDKLRQTGTFITQSNLTLTYTQYDTNKPFLEQAKANYEKLKGIGKDLEEIEEMFFELQTIGFTKEEIEKTNSFIKQMCG